MYKKPAILHSMTGKHLYMTKAEILGQMSKNFIHIIQEIFCKVKRKIEILLLSLPQEPSVTNLFPYGNEPIVRGLIISDIKA